MIKTLKEFLLFPLIVVIFVGIVFLSIDQYCVSDANGRLPVYPGAERIRESHNGIRPRGVGNTLEVFSTQDNLETVESWFAQLALKAVQTNGRTRGVASLSHWFEANPEGQGTLIYNLTQCVM